MEELWVGSAPQTHQHRQLIEVRGQRLETGASKGEGVKGQAALRGSSGLSFFRGRGERGGGLLTGLHSLCQGAASTEEEP